MSYAFWELNGDYQTNVLPAVNQQPAVAQADVLPALAAARQRAAARGSPGAGAVCRPVTVGRGPYCGSWQRPARGALVQPPDQPVGRQWRNDEYHDKYQKERWRSLLQPLSTVREFTPHRFPILLGGREKCHLIWIVSALPAVRHELAVRHAGCLAAAAASCRFGVTVELPSGSGA